MPGEGRVNHTVLELALRKKRSPVQQHPFLKIILSLPLISVMQLSVTDESINTPGLQIRVHI